MSPILDQPPNLKRQEGGSQFEKELNRPEKKRQGGRSQFEEEPTRVDKEGEPPSDYEFGEADSDDDGRDDFMTYSRVTDGGKGFDEPDLDVNDEEERKCDRVPICHFYRHKDRFYALPVFELYKVKLIFDDSLFDSSGKLSGELYGVIDANTSPETPKKVHYFRVTKKNPVHITLNAGKKVINLALSGEKTSPPVACTYDLRVFFAFMFKKSDGTLIDVLKNWGRCLRVEEDAVADSDAEVFDGDEANYDYLWFPPNSFGLHRFDTCMIERIILGRLDDSIKVAAYFAIYDGAWATVDVTILKKGVSRFYGFIYARPCVFFSRIRLLSLQKNEMRELQASNTSIELARPVVVVPSFSSLIIAALLYDQDGNLIVRGKTFFPASENGTQVESIGDDNVKIKVEWACSNSFLA